MELCLASQPGELPQVRSPETPSAAGKDRFHRDIQQNTTSSTD